MLIKFKSNFQYVWLFKKQMIYVGHFITDTYLPLPFYCQLRYRILSANVAFFEVVSLARWPICEVLLYNNNN